MPQVYLLHFDKPLCHAQHYCGWTGNGVAARLATHLKGNGAKIIAAAVCSGLTIRVVRTWQHDSWREARCQERRLKNTHHLNYYCPVCREANKIIIKGG